MPHLQSHTLSREWLRLLTSLTDHRRQRTLVCPIIVSLIRFPSCCSTVLDSTPTKSLCVKKISVSGRPGPGARCTTKCGRWLRAGEYRKYKATFHASTSASATGGSPNRASLAQSAQAAGRRRLAPWASVG